MTIHNNRDGTYKVKVLDQEGAEVPSQVEEIKEFFQVEEIKDV